MRCQWGGWGSHLTVLVWLISYTSGVYVCCIGVQGLGWKISHFIWTAGADFPAAHTHTPRDFLIVSLPPSLLRLSIRRMRKTCLSIRIFEVRFVLRMLLSSWSRWLVVYCDVVPCRLWGLKFWLVGRWFLKHVTKLLVSLLAGGHSTDFGAELSLHVCIWLLYLLLSGVSGTPGLLGSINHSSPHSSNAQVSSCKGNHVYAEGCLQLLDLVSSYCFYHNILMDLANGDEQIVVTHSCQIGIVD